MGGIVAEGNDGAVGTTGAEGGGMTAPGAEGGLGIPGIEGGLGIPGIEGGGMTAPGAEGGLGIPGAEGGLGIAGIPGIEEGGFEPTGAPGGGGIIEPPGTGTGFGGRLIIAVSLGLKAMGEPSRRAGRTILTVSFFGSAIVCSEWVKRRLFCSGQKYSQIIASVSIMPRKIVARRVNYSAMSSFQSSGCAAMNPLIIRMHS
jgi:hypothetical protein